MLIMDLGIWECVKRSVKLAFLFCASAGIVIYTFLP